MFDCIIKNGTVVTSEGTYPYDVAVSGEKIAAVGLRGTLGQARQTVDAAGKLVMPGMIDPHVHIHHPFQGKYAGDDFYTATRSAAFGGVTTVCDFGIQWDKERCIRDTCAARREQFSEGAVTDYAIHACPTRVDGETLEQLEEMIGDDTPSVKLYMTYSRQNRMASDAALLEALSITARKGGIVGVHAENDAMCCYFSDRFKAEGRTSPADFPRCKCNLVEAEAVNRAIYLARATGGNLYIFHLSCKESLELLRRARAEGVHVCAETCIHYLTMTDEKYSRPDGANFICSPPLRSAGDQEALWEGIREGLISVVSSDHCGFTLANKAVGENDFTRTPNGLPGMETRLAAMYTYGVRSGRVSLPRLVELLSANPARIFGMWPRKGAIAAGSDADLVIFDPEASSVVSPETLHSPVDWNPYGGERLYGRADQVLRRGELIVDGGEFLAQPGSGRLAERRAADMIRP